MKKQKHEEITLPSLRGIMGNWVYYSCLMSLNEIGARVRFADEVHNNTRLSEMIQRQLRTSRASQISEYLENQPERFFNSLVVATYDGAPNWYALTDVRSKAKFADLKNLDEETIESVGFLSLRGDEELFAIDGQHRLAGIKRALKGDVEDDPYDDVSVIFVAHKNTSKGLERTRRLFTTLNKTARPVSKGDIIALDEDDVMAISVRRLIEKTRMFSGNRIAFVASNNMPARNVESLTTIGNLYDTLMLLFTKADTDLKKKKADLQKVRPDDSELDAYFSLSKKFFGLLRKNFSELDEFFSSQETVDVVKKYRGSQGGNVMFRPLGLQIFTEIITKLSLQMSLTKAIAVASKLPRDLSKTPYVGLMWDQSNKRILNSHKVTLRETLLYMLDASKFSDKKLLDRYRKAVDDETASLPDKVV